MIFFYYYAESIVKPSVKPFSINILQFFIIHEATVDAAFHKKIKNLTWVYYFSGKNLF